MLSICNLLMETKNLSVVLDATKFLKSKCDATW